MNGKKPKKVLVLTGAGADMPWGGPGTECLTQKLRGDKEFITSSGKNVGEFLYDKLCEALKNDLTNQNLVNFETILDVLGLLYNFVRKEKQPPGPAWYQDTYWLPFFNLREEVKKELFDFEKYSVAAVEDKFRYSKNKKYIFFEGEDFFLSRIYGSFINLIIDEVKRYTALENLNKHTVLNGKFRGFLNHLTDQFDKVRFYTLNYGRLPVLIAGEEKGFFEGFDAQGQIDYGNIFGNGPEALKKRRLTHFFLHGSIHFDFDNKKRVEFNKSGIDSCPWTSISNPRALSGDILMESPIVAGLRKADTLLLQHIYPFYQKFVQDCIDADTIIVIGYGFGDPHINKAFLLSTKIRKEKDVIIVDYDDGGQEQDVKILKGIENPVNLRKSGAFEDAFKKCFDLTDPCTAKGTGWSVNGGGKLYYCGFEEFLKKEEWMEIETKS